MHFPDYLSNPKNVLFSAQHCTNMTIVINCAGDAELADRIRQFLLRSKTSPDASISIVNDEIMIQDPQSTLQDKDVRKLLDDFLASNNHPAGYSITQFGEIFTVGIPQSIDKLVISCEICGYLAHDEDELMIHKRTHALFAPL